MHTGDKSVAPWQPVRTWYSAARSAMRRRWVMPPACVTVLRMKSMSWFSIRPLQSQMLLKISPTASGVVVCWRIKRNASWFSAGVASSIQNRRYGSRSLPKRAASIGVKRWCTSCSKWMSGPTAARTASNSLGVCARYLCVAQSCSLGSDASAGS